MGRILIIGPTPPPYHGVSVATEMILNSNLQRKFKIIHLDTADRRDLSNIGKIDFTNIYLAFEHFLKFIWLCIREKPEIVYIPISQTTLGYLRDCLFLVPAKIFHKKVIVHLHGGYFRKFYEGSSKLMKNLIEWTLKEVKRAIVLGESLRYIFQGLVPDERIVVVPNGVDEKLFEKTNLTIDTKSKNHIKVLFLGNLIKSKGFFDVIKAIPKVIRRYSNVKFIFAGKFPNNYREQNEVFRYIEQNKLDSVVKFMEVVPGEKKIKLLLFSDVFIFPSYNEGHPFVILEAMAAGLPIITTDVGAIRETVIDKENGFIIEKNNPKQIAEKIITLIKNPELRKKMGEKSRQRFLKYYTKDKFIENLSNVFREVFEMAKN
ncbi:MAG TPA: glycosyltransferase family 1 protein [Candidatus Atribacteria bacterium]|uniref:Group 1 glycosyl transferase n=2 Tax=Desulfofervidus auxilii TaxID=1621989 RepID=A0A7U4TIL6_DESA2|nr:group 1 glycosyl transferase [Candidatus Desulfofervidus auxilii]HEC92677.1 glycosyltransferase family 1 protein [Candidatus Atribacteria bacterium]